VLPTPPSTPAIQGGGRETEHLAQLAQGSPGNGTTHGGAQQHHGTDEDSPPEIEHRLRGVPRTATIAVATEAAALVIELP